MIEAPKRIERWLDAGFKLIGRDDSKKTPIFELECRNGHVLHKFLKNLSTPSCHQCSLESCRANKENENRLAYQGLGWETVEFSGNKVTLTCGSGHTITKTNVRPNPCMECKRNAEYESDVEHIKKTMYELGLEIIEIHRKNPRCASRVKYKCANGVHYRDASFSEVRSSLTNYCAKCRLGFAK